MTSTDHIGQGYRFRLVEEPQADIWVCFAQSPDNPAILRLAPALSADAPQAAALGTTDTPLAAKLREQDGTTYWLVGGIEVRAHEVDLADPEVAFPAGRFEMADAAPSDRLETSARAQAETAYADLVERLTRAAIAIEEAMHEGGGANDDPQLADCQITEIDPAGRSATFYWRQDRNRRYRLSPREGDWLLQQHYEVPDAQDADRQVPLRIGAQLCAFGRGGMAELTPALAQALIEMLGLPFAARPAPPSSIRLRWPLTPAATLRALHASTHEAGPAQPVERHPFTLAGGTIRGQLALIREAGGTRIDLSLESDAPAQVRLLLRDARAEVSERQIDAELHGLALWRQRLGVGPDSLGIDLVEDEQGAVLTVVYPESGTEPEGG